MESGFILRRNLIPCADPMSSTFVRNEDPQSGIPLAFWEIAPDVAIESSRLLRPRQDVRDKIHDYLAT